MHIACAYNKPFAAIYSGYERNFALFHPLDQKGAYAIRSNQKVDKPVKQISQWSAEELFNCVKGFLTK